MPTDERRTPTAHDEQVAEDRAYFATHCDSPREDREMSDRGADAWERERDGWWG